MCAFVSSPPPRGHVYVLSVRIHISIQTLNKRYNKVANRRIVACDDDTTGRLSKHDSSQPAIVHSVFLIVLHRIVRMHCCCRMMPMPRHRPHCSVAVVVELMWHCCCGCDVDHDLTSVNRLHIVASILCSESAHDAMMQAFWRPSLDCCPLPFVACASRRRLSLCARSAIESRFDWIDVSVLHSASAEK